MFDYDWFHGPAYEQQQQSARRRVALRQYPDVSADAVSDHADCRAFMEALECRTLIYLRDGFSYEIGALADDVSSKVHLTFESEPSDDLYKVGAFVVTVLFEDICRVEVYAVHPTDKPENKPMITGFRSASRHEDRKADD